MLLTRDSDPIPVPLAPEAKWIERLLWVFLFSFALDYRAEAPRTTPGYEQLVFLFFAGISTLGILTLGWRRLTVRPGAWLLLLWGGFLAFMFLNAAGQGVDPGRWIRVGLPFALCFAAMLNCHIAGCAGIRPAAIVGPVFAIAVVNVIWRMAQGFLFKEITIESVRVEVQSSANNWIAAFIGCSLLLRRRFHWSLFLAAGVLFSGILITVTRSLLLPIAASALATSFCFLLGARWGIHRPIDGLKRLLPVIAVSGFALIVIGCFALAFPVLLERWDERLFHHASDVNLTQDISWITRRAEASAIFEILNQDKVHYLFGHGFGATYRWDADYLPEIRMVYPDDADPGKEVWFAGHSMWTYAIFSGGVIGLLAHLGLILGTMGASLAAARANASHPGPDQWLAFLPFVAAACLLSETLTTNAFDERVAAMIFGIMAGLPQAFFIRASWIHSSPYPSRA